jgi:hypothetical protein
MKNHRLINIIDKVLAWLDDKKIAVIALVVLFVSLVPFFYLAHYARPMWDDLAYARDTHAAWLDSGSLIAVAKAAVYTARNSYMSWGGEWLGYVFYGLMPEVFAPYTFWPAPYFFVLINTGSTALLLYYFGSRVFGLSWEYTSIIYAVLFLFMMQYLPSYNIGIYWYVGAVHYIVPHVAFLLSLVCIHRFLVTKAKRYIMLTSLCTLIIGGFSLHYSLMVCLLYATIIVLFFKKGPALWLLVPCVICLAGFIAQILAPSNRGRGGTDFGFNLEYVFVTIWRSFTQELSAPLEYFARVPLLLPAFLIAIVFGWLGLLTSIRNEKCTLSFRYPLAYIIFVFLLNAALNAPRIYAVDMFGVDNASHGPQTVEWLMFFLTWLSAALYCEGWAIKKLSQPREKTPPLTRLLLDVSSFRKAVVFPTLALCLVLLIFWRSTLVNDCFFSRAYEYVRSGDAANYKKQMAEYMDILLDDSIEEAILKPVNDKQGPLIHWIVTGDEDSYHNWSYQVFYRKKRVVVPD